MALARKNTDEGLLPEAPGICLPCLSVGWVFRNWHSFVCFHLSARFFVYIPACLTWPAVHCSLSQLRLFLRASLISCPLCLRPVSTLGSRSGIRLRDLKVASYVVGNVIKLTGLILNSLFF